MTRLVDDLLEVSRATLGRIQLYKESILAASAVHAAVETVRPIMRERDQTLQLDVPHDIEITADQARLTQVLVNLLNNASKYTQPGGKIMVQVLETEEHVEIIVRDNGPGIPKELLPVVFELFTQAPTTIDRSRGGLGLGLALVKRLIELHGGRVKAESDGAGVGASFTVCLPRTERRRITRSIDSWPPNEAIAPTTFLVVDDNPDALDTLAVLLEADGHHVERARDGEEALSVARRFVPRVVILDIGLPKLDGWEVARRLRADPTTAGTVLIALSGYGQGNDRQTSRESGFDAHLLKPADLRAIYGTAHACMMGSDQGSGH
jgi:CheY-like chemotaxis protein/two-component sensor histidine kinase